MIYKSFAFFLLFLMAREFSRAADTTSFLSLPEENEILAELNAIATGEKNLGVPPAHQTQHLLLRESGRLVRTPLTVVITHGLLNSPASMKWIAERAHSLNLNVLNVRLPGHFQKERTDTDLFKFEEAFQQSERIGVVAEKLGDRVVFIGHSVGGSLSILSALNHPDTTAGLVLFSPALRVSLLTYYSTQVLSYFGVSGWLADLFTGADPSTDYRYLSTHAGVEVDLLSQRLATRRGENQYEFIKRSFKDLPIFWVDTEIDIVIDTRTNQEVAFSLDRTEYLVFPWNLGIAHDFTSLESTYDSSLKAKARESFTKKWVEFLKALKTSS